jgi:hypothetical protein
MSLSVEDGKARRRDTEARRPVAAVRSLALAERVAIGIR